MLAEQTRTIPVRPLPTQSSKTIISADKRTRELAQAMVKLNAEGVCTVEALLREGFSHYELNHLADAARAVANGIFVRVEAEPAPPSDDDLVELSLQKAVTRKSFDPLQLRTVMRGLYMTDDVIARIWPKLCVKLAAHVARLPLPGAVQ